MNNRQTPKPLKVEFDGSQKRATFNAEELRQFVRDNEDAAFLVEDGKGNSAAILIRPIREFLESEDIDLQSVQSRRPVSEP